MLINSHRPTIVSGATDAVWESGLQADIAKPAVLNGIVSAHGGLSNLVALFYLFGESMCLGEWGFWSFSPAC